MCRVLRSCSAINLAFILAVITLSALRESRELGAATVISSCTTVTFSTFFTKSITACRSSSVGASPLTRTVVLKLVKLICTRSFNSFRSDNASRDLISIASSSIMVPVVLRSAATVETAVVAPVIATGAHPWNRNTVTIGMSNMRCERIFMVLLRLVYGQSGHKVNG